MSIAQMLRLPSASSVHTTRFARKALNRDGNEVRYNEYPHVCGARGIPAIRNGEPTKCHLWLPESLV